MTNQEYDVTLKINQPASVLLGALDSVISEYEASRRRVTEYTGRFEVDIESVWIPEMLNDNVMELLAMKLVGAYSPSGILNMVLQDRETYREKGERERITFEIREDEEGNSILGFNSRHYRARPQRTDVEGINLYRLKENFTTLKDSTWLSYIVNEPVFTIQNYVQRMVDAGFSVTCAVCGEKYDVDDNSCYACFNARWEAEKLEEKKLYDQAAEIVIKGIEDGSVVNPITAKGALDKSGIPELQGLDAFDRLVQDSFVDNLDLLQKKTARLILDGIKDGRWLSNNEAREANPDIDIRAWVGAWKSTLKERVQYYWDTHIEEKEALLAQIEQINIEIPHLETQIEQQEKDLAQLTGFFKKKQRQEVSNELEILRKRLADKRDESRKLSDTLQSYPPA